MSSSEAVTISRRALLRGLAGLAVVSVLPLSACTVRPLYGDVSASTAASAMPGSGSIGVRQVDTRVAQQVRNHLVFALNGGAAEPADPRYSVRLNVTSLKQSSGTVQIGQDNEPTAGTITVSSTYSITDGQTQTVVARGRRSAVAAYDRPLQEFALLRAEIDAENRAARELAEFLRLAIAQDMETAALK